MRFLVFDNRNGLGLASKLILNYDSIKYIKPSNATTFFIELNSGANIELTLGTGNSSEVIDSINRVIKANPNTSVLNVNPSEVGGFLFSSIVYNVAASGSIDGGGAANEIAVFTDPNTIGGIANGNAGALLVANGAGSDPSFSVNPGGAGQVLTSNGPGSNPSYQALPSSGTPFSELSVDVNAAGQLLDSVALDGTELQAYYFAALSDTATAEPQGINQVSTSGSFWGGIDWLQPLVFACGADSTAGYADYYSKYDTVWDPFKYADQATGSGLPGWPFSTVSIGDPQYIWPNVMVPLGYGANQWTSETRFTGQVICNNGTVTFNNARYITCDGSTLAGSLNAYIAYSKVYSADFVTNIIYRNLTIYFGGTTANVTVV